MVSRMEVYRVKRRDNLADPEFWNPRLADIDGRLNAREQDVTRIDNAVDELEAVALQRINDTFTPLIVEAQNRLNNLGASFSAESLDSKTIATGAMDLVLTEDSATNYVYTDYVQIRSSTAPDNSMLGQVVSFDRPSRLLSVNVVHVEGSGTYSDWLIRVGAPIDLTHADRKDNPHEVTAAQLGSPAGSAPAYTKVQTDAAIAAAIAAIPSSTYLVPNLNFSDVPDKAAARTNLGLKLLATQDTVGIGQIASSVFATPANIRAAAADKVIQADDLFASAAYVAVEGSGAINWDLDNGFNFTHTMVGNQTLSFPAHPKPGQSGFIDFIQPSGGGCSLGFAAGFTFDQGVVPTLDTAANRISSLFYHVRSATEVRVSIAFKGVR